jgi:hypothetical protein
VAVDLYSERSPGCRDKGFGHCECLLSDVFAGDWESRDVKSMTFFGSALLSISMQRNARSIAPAAFSLVNTITVSGKESFAVESDNSEFWRTQLVQCFSGCESAIISSRVEVLTAGCLCVMPSFRPFDSGQTNRMKYILLHAVEGNRNSWPR